MRKLLPKAYGRLLLVMALLFTVQVHSQDVTLHFPDVILTPGGTGEVTVSYTTTREDLHTFQMEFDLPDGLHLVDGRLSDDLRNFCSSHELRLSDRRSSDNKTVIFTMDWSGEKLPCGTNDLMTLTFSAADEVPLGIYPITTSYLVFTTFDDGREDVELGPQTFNINEIDDDDIIIEGIYYTINSDGTAEVIYPPNNLVYSGHINLPSTISYKGKNIDVKKIGDGAFSNSNIESIIIPNSVTSIGEGAFSDCSMLTTITIPNSVTSIGCDAFIDCPNLPVYDNIRYADTYLIELIDYTVKSAEIREDTRFIGSYAFTYCSELTTISIPDGVMSIGEGAFERCSSLTSVTIPNSVTSIGEGAFSRCSALTSVTIPNSVTSIGGEVFSRCSALTSVTIPNSVTSIGDWAFYFCSALTSVTIPNSVTSIGDGAFVDCSSLTSVSIGSNVTSIGVNAFYNCSNITIVTINSNTILSKTYSLSFSLKNVFGTEVEKYIIGEAVTSIGNYAFYNCSNVTSIDISNSVTSIGWCAFYDCTSLTSVIFGTGVKKIGDDAFRDCSQLTRVNISDITSWCNISFITHLSNPLNYAHNLYLNDALITNLVIPDGIKEIKDYAFYGCSNLTTITIPNSVTSIGQWSFSGCSNLKTIDIPNSVTSIKLYAFRWCSNIQEIFCLNPEPISISYNVFENIVYTSATLYVLFSSIDLYKSQSPWSNFVNIFPWGGQTSISLVVKDDQNNDVTNLVHIKWYDENDNDIGTGSTLYGVEEGKKVFYSILLDENLGRSYKEVVHRELIFGNNPNVVCNLERIGSLTLYGRVSAYNIDQLRANVMIKQMLNGKYEEQFNTQTDEKGDFSVEVYDCESDVTVSCDGYFETTIHRDGFGADGNMGTVPLNLISGYVVRANIVGLSSIAEGDMVQTNNIELYDLDLILYNETNGSELLDYTIQKDKLIIKSGASDGDVIRLTASSKSDLYADGEIYFTISANGDNSFTLEMTEHGGLDATCNHSDNGGNVGYLYDDSGLLVAKGSYKGTLLSLRNLKDGNYQLISMGTNFLLGGMLNINRLSSIGMKDGRDYVSSSVEIKKGIITPLNIESIPILNEEDFYYTNSNTYVNINKPSITVGNYATVSAYLAFKDEYADIINQVRLCVEIPQGCHLVDNSIICGRKMIPYTFVDGIATMNLSSDDIQNTVRFCIIPEDNRTYTISAIAIFDVDGMVQQPIGNVNLEAKGLSISAPENTATTEIVVRGTAPNKCKVDIYDNDVLIGTTNTNGFGDWSVNCTLYKPYTSSFHDIYYKTYLDDGKVLPSESKLVCYDKNRIVPSKVTIVYNNPEMGDYNIVFDQITGKTTPSYYYFFPYKNWPNWSQTRETEPKDFTFMAEFTKNDTTIVKNVKIKVKNTDGTSRTLSTVFDTNKNVWVATTKYENNSRLPQNVKVEYDYLGVSDYDDERVNDEYANIQTCLDLLDSYIDENCSMEIIKDEEDVAILYIIDNNTDENHLIEYRNINPCNLNLSDFVYIEEEDFYIMKTLTTDYFEAIIFDHNINEAYSYRMSLSNESMKNTIYPQNRIKKNGENILGFIADFQVPFISYILDLKNYYYYIWYWNTRFDALEKTRYSVQKQLMSCCSDGNFKLPGNVKTDCEIEFFDICGLKDGAAEIIQEIFWEWWRELVGQFSIETIGGKIFNKYAEKMAHYKANGSNNSYLIKGGKNIRNRWEKVLKKTINIPETLTERVLLDGSPSEVVSGVIDSFFGEISMRFDRLSERIKSNYRNCPNKEPEDEEDDDDYGDPVTPIMDPSGYVYEGVFSNRLEGVTVSCYHKDLTEDMYGDIHEEIVFWNADEYGQHNPLQTDHNGFYSWDVPQGSWQVKYEKEGYETTYSEWLPVPPPQLDVNMGMIQTTPPVVKKAQGFESGVVVDMSKYMRSETMNINNIILKQNGSKVNGKIDLLNAEESPSDNQSLASKVKFIPENRFHVGEQVVLTIRKDVESYCGVKMSQDYTQTITIEPEITAIVIDNEMNISYQGQRIVDVFVEPAEASAGRILIAESSSPMIVSVDEISHVINENGYTRLTLNGDLPGGTMLKLSIENSDAVASSKIHVIGNDKLVAMPTASIMTGQVVSVGTKVELSCTTDGATIYYTTDGLCPCDEATRHIYNEPIAIMENVVIKAMAVKEGMDDSDIATFIYRVTGTGVEKVLSDSSVDMSLKGNNLIIKGAKDGICCIYDAQGAELINKHLKDNLTTISLPHSTIYIVEVELPNGERQVEKFVVK